MIRLGYEIASFFFPNPLPAHPPGRSAMPGSYATAGAEVTAAQAVLACADAAVVLEPAVEASSN